MRIRVNRVARVGSTRRSGHAPHRQGHRQQQKRATSSSERNWGLGQQTGVVSKRWRMVDEFKCGAPTNDQG
eukprot:4335889-Pleurochrysis_carterae.AAC.3